ncbi:glucose-6-phosphate isomerase [Tumebacillus avium]|uniref:Glucose-6-phosphate isomerase n=1 Tax=Tumebacillus avium TaxID=1903704 RepID=A0A1Y0IMD4_9BACL|nr:glucose-6-phosphate isomerase [Tumebacillus avium]ARU61209.1 glucose-6-phosphate isomerase [Tumebacillus avium]
MSKLHVEFPAAAMYTDGSRTADWQAAAKRAHDQLHGRSGPGQEWLGWLDPPSPDDEETRRIAEAAEEIRARADALLVIGIGGSYAGARAAIELLTPPFSSQLPREQRKGPDVYFLGQNLSASYINSVLSILADKDVEINVVSKSGTTTEPALALRIAREWMIKKYGRQEAATRIIATTDRTQGALRRFAESEGWRMLAVPADVGGRYSVLTAAGLLPMSVAGLKIGEMLLGAQEASVEYAMPDLDANGCYRYAVWRNELYRQGKQIELLAAYEPAFCAFAEWWKQLFGESEGKDGKGIFPAAAQFSTDLHSLGQYIQDGPRHMFETVLWVELTGSELLVPFIEEDPDGLNYLTGKSVCEVNEQAYRGTIEAHQDGKVPNLLLTLAQLDERHVGHLFYFFEKACALSGYLLGVNPFDQPGVEAYKGKMFKLLGKPGWTV